jgi:hypothetical protein
MATAAKGLLAILGTPSKGKLSSKDDKEPEEEEEDEAEEGDGDQEAEELDAMGEFLQAVKDDDKEAARDSLKAFLAACGVY